MDDLLQRIFLYYLLGGLSIVLGSYVLYHVYAHIGYQTLTLRLIFYLHMTLWIENIFTLPEVYDYNVYLCHLAGICRTYAGLANAMTMMIFSLHHRRLLFHQHHTMTQFFIHNRIVMIFVFPLITLLPLINQAYGQSDGFCYLESSSETDLIWTLSTYYGWITLIFLCTLLQILSSVWYVYQTDPTLATALFKCVGGYIVIAWCTWIPRLCERLSLLSRFNSSFIQYLCGILFFVIFMSTRKTLETYEKNAQVHLPDYEQDHHDRSMIVTFNFDISNMRNFLDTIDSSSESSRSQQYRNKSTTTANTLANSLLAANGNNTRPRNESLPNSSASTITTVQPNDQSFRKYSTSTLNSDIVMNVLTVSHDEAEASNNNPNNVAVVYPSINRARTRTVSNHRTRLDSWTTTPATTDRTSLNKPLMNQVGESDINM